MTFKHAKFEDSVIMRSLEKIAREKGMIKDDPIQKTASTQIDLKPSDSLMQNILTLCAGLRAQGFDKHANELEVNFLAYKQAANALYETDPKAGEKQIRDAHPKGSPKLEGVEGGDLAVVETIIDEHLKLLDIVNKKPTGKLESSAAVLSAVKKALGQAAAPTAPVAPEVLGDPDALVESAIAKLNVSINSIASQSDIGRGVNYMRSYVKDIKNLSRDINVKNVMEMRKLAGKILDYASTGNHGVFRRYFESWLNWAGASISDKYDAVLEGAGNIFGGGFEMEPGALKSALDGIGDAIKTFGKVIRSLSAEKPKPATPTPTTTPTAPAAETDPSQKVIQGFKTAIDNIGLYKARIESRELPNAAALNTWLDSAKSFSEKYMGSLSSSKYKSDPDVINSASQKLETVKSKLEAFRQKWLP